MMRRDVTLLVAGKCNLSCSYCYQSARTCSQRMGTRVARTAIEAAFEGEPAHVTLTMGGGEPLLEEELVRECIRSADSLRPAATQLDLSLTTNGTLLTRPLIDVLVDHNVTMYLSFDGVVEAQSLRSRESWQQLDRLLDEVGDNSPTYFAKNLRVSMLLTAGTISHLARSVRYLLDKGVKTIRISPPLTPDPLWSDELSGPLQKQIAAIAEMCERIWIKSGQVPVTFLHPDPSYPRKKNSSEFLCRAPQGSSYTVDPDGRVWACPLFASSLRKVPPAARRATRVFELGHISSQRLHQKLDGMVGPAQTIPVLTGRAEKFSSYGKCGDCEYLSDCQICPASICHASEDGNPDRVPDFMCAFNRTVIQSHHEFWNRNRGPGLVQRLDDIVGSLRRAYTPLSRAE